MLSVNANANGMTMKNFLYAICTAVVWGLVIACSSDQMADVNPNGQTGVGGSMARFAIVGNALYCVLPDKLQVYDISTPTEPVAKSSVKLSVGLETIFPYKDNLFIGANDGMYIFDNQQPATPLLLSRFTHVQSCDPVVVQGNFAYVTLRGGVSCRRFMSMSSLDVVDISDLKSPRLIHSQPMESPYGLGVDGTKLFVCEGNNGLKIFDISKPEQPVLRETIKDVKSFDVIPLNKTLLVTGDGGFFQYSYQKEGKLELLSKISIEP
ncbi:LVIVD repeat-containing protein [Runella sp.]|uniref:LVIVD repeat-containing protein n=1 Tax=Runella sp. TaxID=1960881 RepID=UPI003D0AEAF2